MKRYFFPEQAVTIEAETLAEATKYLQDQWIDAEGKKVAVPDALQSKRKKRS